MSHPTASNRQPALSAPRRAWARSAARGLVAAVAVLGMAWLAVAAPIASPATVATPANKGLYTSVTETARAAYLQAMFADGYVLLPAIKADDAFPG